MKTKIEKPEISIFTGREIKFKKGEYVPDCIISFYDNKTGKFVKTESVFGSDVTCVFIDNTWKITATIEDYGYMIKINSVLKDCTDIIKKTLISKP